MEVDRVMLPTAFNVHANIQADTPKILHPEPLLHLTRDLPNHALVSKDKKIIDVQNNRGNDYVLILIMEHKQCSIDT
jgi:hypothetical protein